MVKLYNNITLQDERQELFKSKECMKNRERRQ